MVHNLATINPFIPSHSLDCSFSYTRSLSETSKRQLNWCLKFKEKKKYIYIYMLSEQKHIPHPFSKNRKASKPKSRRARARPGGWQIHLRVQSERVLRCVEDSQEPRANTDDLTQTPSKSNTLLSGDRLFMAFPSMWRSNHYTESRLLEVGFTRQNH